MPFANRNNRQELILVVSPPNIENFKLRGRACREYGPECDVHAFFPPHSPTEWPQKVGDIGNTYMRRLLGWTPYHQKAKGLLIDGKVYTNDIPFWLSLTKDKRPRVVYEKPSWSEWREWFEDIIDGSNVYMDDYPIAELNPETRLEFDLEEWDRIVHDRRWAWHFFPRRPMADAPASLYPDESFDPPPPYVARQDTERPSVQQTPENRRDPRAR